MPKTSAMRESKFLKQTDVGRGVLAHVDVCEEMNVAKEDDDPELKWCMTFMETTLKPLVLNSTNIQLCEKIFGSDDTDDWRGHALVLYTDPNVSFQGKLTGGLRVRAPKVKTTAPVVAPKLIPKSVSRPDPELDQEPEYDPITEDDIPFAWLLPLMLPMLSLLG